MENSNNKGTVGKHPIPHAEGIIKSDEEQNKEITDFDKKGSNEEE